MARVPFTVQYLIFCGSVEYADPHRPHRDSILNGVDFAFGVPPNAEFPIEPDEFWLFARFYSRSDQIGQTRPLSVTCVWHNGPTGGQIEVWRRDLGPVRFFRPGEVVDRAWAFRNFGGKTLYRFPGLGLYEFRLWYPMKKWPGRQLKAREYIRVEVQP